MLVSKNWIEDYLELENMPSDEEFCSRMIMSGSNIETSSPLVEACENIKIGRIDKIEKHPYADRLSVCQVSMGTRSFQIITSASNIYEGAYIPVALDGSVVPGPLHGSEDETGPVTIKAGTLRGMASDGMMCGPQELGIPEKIAPLNSKDGIWLLPGNWDEHLGDDFIEATGLKDTIIDFEITPNRPDCLSMIGMAREAAATFGGKLIYPEIRPVDPNGTEKKTGNMISVEIHSDACRRYTARIIENVKIGESPWWLQKKLMSAGIRPINNIVDITNFVMAEYGQPLHAFDIRNIEGNKIVVEEAHEGEIFTSLDGNERTLKEDMLMIKDGKKSIAIAGIMGGLNSEIRMDTETVVIESANFAPESVRKTSKTLGLRTEASSRYEKALDPNLCEVAADRVMTLVKMIGCGREVPGVVDVYPSVRKPKAVKARVSRINKVLGTSISRKEMESILESLEMKVEGEGDDLIITAPTVRMDLPEEVDFVEEIARMYGYDKLPSKLPDLATEVKNAESWNMRKLAGNTLCGMGLYEIQTFSFISEKDFDLCKIPEDAPERDTVKIINPMGDDTEAMRTIVTPAMLKVLARNYAHSRDHVRLFEIGTVYRKNPNGENMLPRESHNLAIGLYGEGEDFFSLKGIINALAEALGEPKLDYEAEESYPLYHPGRCARINIKTAGGDWKELGIMGEIHPDVAENYGIEERVYVAEIFFDILAKLSKHEIHYKGMAKYPAMTRDIAIVVDENTQVKDIEKVILGAGSELLKDLKLFDIYRGDQLEEGKKSVAYRLVYRHDDRTLTDKETDLAHAKILEALESQIGAAIRE
jgi:phenylalanyl-tRNA synthetase beta chain